MKKKNIVKEEEKGLIKTFSRYVRKRSISRRLEMLFYTQEGVENNISFLAKFKKKHSLKKKEKNSKEQEEDDRIVIDETIERFYPSTDEGLSEEQVKGRTEAGLTNNEKLPTTKTYRSIFIKNIFTVFNMLWAVIAAALIAVGSYKDLLFIFVIVANTTIAIVQEIRAKIAVEKLSIVTTPMVKTIRAGKTLEIPSDKLVLDDVIVLTSGNQIPSDCIIINGSVDVNESLLTGESNAIEKSNGAMLLSGSFIVSGLKSLIHFKFCLQ